jgi:DNA polymerase-4
MRKIIHCDCDCFYASVEMRDDPSLRFLPLAVGGDSDRRGVIATCNYLARSYGVRSAMPTGQAKKLCPGLLVIPPSMDKYRKAAEQVRAIFLRYTDVIEPLSLDEAYLDVTESPHCQGSATRIAEEIRRAVAEEVGITISAGVAGNKFLAKVASDWNKPDGLMVIAPDHAARFAAQLPVEKIHGVGKVMAQRLHQSDLRTGADILDIPLHELVRQFGKFGQHLYHCARGDDQRPVQTRRQRKSLSVEHTYPEDLPTEAMALMQVEALLSRLESRMEKASTSKEQICGAFVKLKSSDFQTTTVERRVDCAVPDVSVYHDLTRQAWGRLNQPVRLLGVGLRFKEEPENSQLDRQIPLNFPKSVNSF